MFWTHEKSSNSLNPAWILNLLVRQSMQKYPFVSGQMLFVFWLTFDHSLWILAPNMNKHFSDNRSIAGVHNIKKLQCSKIVFGISFHERTPAWKLLIISNDLFMNPLRNWKYWFWSYAKILSKNWVKAFLFLAVMSDDYLQHKLRNGMSKKILSLCLKFQPYSEGIAMIAANNQTDFG